MSGVIPPPPDSFIAAVRLEIFRHRHPDVCIGCEFGVWNAVVPRCNGERVLARDTLTWLLDDLDDILAGGDPRARPG